MRKCGIKRMELGGFSIQKPTLEYSKGYGVGSGAATGALGGAGTGAALGTAVGGPIGTVVGAIGGGLIGGLSGLFGGLSKRKAGRDAELSQYQNELRDYNLAKQSYIDNLQREDSMQLKDSNSSGYDVQSMYKFGGNINKIPKLQIGGYTENPPDTLTVNVDKQTIGNVDGVTIKDILAGLGTGVVGAGATYGLYKGAKNIPKLIDKFGYTLRSPVIKKGTEKVVQTIAEEGTKNAVKNSILNKFLKTSLKMGARGVGGAALLIPDLLTAGTPVGEGSTLNKNNEKLEKMYNQYLMKNSNLLNPVNIIGNRNKK